MWLPSITQTTPSFDDLKTVNISLLAASLNAFIFHHLPRILIRPRETIEWHFNPLCHTCQYNADCRSQTVAQSRLGCIPHISPDEAKTLKTLLGISHRDSSVLQPQTTDIEDLYMLFANPTKVATLEKSFPSTVKSAKRILGLPRKNASRGSSSVIDAARTQKIQVRSIHLA